MRHDIDIKAQQYFTQRFGVAFDQLLAPIDAAHPGGQSLRGNGVYRTIQEARRQDDPTLPLGPWERELKRADWDKVAVLAVQALAQKSKDLQLAVWLLEAQINRDGFAGVAPCLVLIERLCRLWWEQLYPRADGADIEYRINVIHWANEKLLPVLRLVPITQAGREERELNWADWEQARRAEQRRAALNGQAPEAAEGVNALEYATAMAGTASEWHVALHEQLGDALAAIEELTRTLDELCGQDAPSLHGLAVLLEQIQLFIEAELHKRGVHLDRDAATATEEQAAAELASADDGPIHDRAAAYAQLARAADYLLRIEPHSPVPYLIKRAVAWGNLNTAELYQELFVKFGGQLNIFELLGLQSESGAREH
ncbi:MAG: type VI secretion system protein TssA [Sulfurifustaceae bacterium]